MEPPLDVWATADFPKGVSHSDGGRVHAGNAMVTELGQILDVDCQTYVWPMPSEIMSWSDMYSLKAELGR